MAAESSEYDLEPLREEAGFTFYRGRQRSDQLPVFAVAAAAEQASPQSIRQLEHEFSLARELDARWAAKPLALARHQGRAALILEDPGGEPLDRVVERHKRQPIDLTRFLRIAVGMTAALGQTHRQGVIHKDIKPSNALVDDSGHVRLTGFGIASRLPRERPAPSAPEVLAGTLAYMSPEQTGRMNRSVDTRSDLYSLGITLYQLLTGSLPFAATDPLGWVHCHIARQPTAPIERRPVPVALSTIIMRLLAKNAEDRYQTAAGLEADLQRCLTEWQLQRRIDPFPLGAVDASDRLLIPEKLYGREREVDALLTVFDRVAAQGTAELVLVSGYSGVGKSSVVNELQKVLVPPRGLFASGKFDQYKRGIPYATVAQAFQGLVLQLLGKSEVELQAWRDAFRETLGSNGALVSGLIGELELVIGTQPAVSELPPQDAKRRFQTALRRFIAVFARPEHPLALFLDDLQWLDDATLDLLTDILVEGDIPHLLLIGAYRDNEVDAAHPLMRRLNALRGSGAIVHDIALTPLSTRDVERMIADSMRCEPGHARPLAQLLQEKTGGNPFFVHQFLYALADESLLTFDHAEARWSWDLSRIHAKRYTDNVVDLMVAKLNRMPTTALAVIRQLACVGFDAESALLGTICQMSPEDLHEHLREAVRSRLVLRSENSYMFPHDRILEAAYSLVPVEVRAQEHLRIGRVLLEHTPPDRREAILFDIASQLNRGATLITSEDERRQLAELNLAAGKRAKASTAHASALEYFIAGRKLLTNEDWEKRGDLIFQLELHRAECEFLTGEPAVAAERLEMLRTRAGDTVALARATCMSIDVCISLGQTGRAITISLEYLRRIGIEWSEHPTDEQVRSEYDRVWSQLGTRPIEAILDLPLMSDPASIATLDVLTKASDAAVFTDTNFYALVICRAASMSIERGNNDGSCIGYVWLGAIAVHRFGDYNSAFRFGQVGYDLLERRGLKRFEAATATIFAAGTMPWMKHLAACCRLMREAFAIAGRNGDLTWAAYSRITLNSLLLAAGYPLMEVQGEAEYGLHFAQKAKFGPVVDMITIQLSQIRTLRGATTQFGSLDNADFDEARFERHVDSCPAATQLYYWVRKLQARFLAGDFASALEASSKARLRLSTKTTFEVAEYDFYSALTRAALVNSTAPDQARDHLEALAAHHKRLTRLAEHCPENFEDRAALIGAELARVEGRPLDAERLLEQAIRAARANGFAHNEALAYETAARFHAARGLVNFSELFLVKARDAYRHWGADGKVRQLEARCPWLSSAEERWRGTANTTPDQQLDVAAVVKASQALSGEVLLTPLLERLMAIALQNAGADRGLLLRPVEKGYRVQAEARADGEGIVLDLSGSENAPVPETLIRYVMRTHKSVVLDDATQQHLFSEDPYLLLRRPRSVLCLPLVRQAALRGLLYLENTLAPGVFTAERARLLELLASQAAISLENAALYAELQRSEAFLAQGQRASHTGSFGWGVASGELYWSDEIYNLFEYARDVPATMEAAFARVHPGDRDALMSVIDAASRKKEDFEVECRLVMPDGRVKNAHATGRVVSTGNLDYVGAVRDVTERTRAEESLRQAQSDLAHINRVTTMGEMAASLAHEIRQPLTGILTNASVCLRKVDGDRFERDELRAPITRLMKDAERATEIVRRIRAQFEKGSVKMAALGMSELLQETVALLRPEMLRYNISVRMDLATASLQVAGDRVQLQQVAMNLIVNGIESMKDVEGPRDLTIRARSSAEYPVLVSVSDTGAGFPPELAERIFDPFFTTKPHGTGMGLRISRSIVESHGGRLWAEAAEGRGATFHIGLPAAEPGRVLF